MTRSRSRSRTRQTSSYQRSRSRSPTYVREKQTHFEQRNYRGNPYYVRGRGNFHRRGRDDYRQSRGSPPRSPGHYKARNRSESPVSRNHHQSYQDSRKGFPDDHHKNSRSPSRYEASYRRSRSPTPQPVITDSNAKDDMIFRGPEGTLINLRELKKITVGIRRNLPRESSSGSHAPLRYSFDPADFVLIRRPGEGSRPIFDREELKLKPAEERVIKLADDVQERTEPPPSQERDSYSGQQNYPGTPDERSGETDGEGDLRYRLMEKKSEENRDRISTDPNFVPQGRYYYEHDNRERFNTRGRGFGYRGNRGNYQNGGVYRGNYRGGGGGHFREQYRGSGQYRGKLRSPEWQHDLYDQVAVDDGKPSSTTQM